MVLWVPWLELGSSLPRPLLLTARCQVGLGIPVGFFTHLGLAGHSQSPSRSCVIRSGSATVTAVFMSHYGKLLFLPDEREASLTCVRAGTGAGGTRDGGAESQGLDRCSKQRVLVFQLSGQCSDCKRSQELVAADSPGCSEAERDSLPQDF